MQSSLNSKCDLHIHSIYSDSDATIEDIFIQAANAKLACIAITDHDTINGLTSAKEMSQRYGVELIDALEISAQHDNVEVHILGYYINPASAALISALARVRETRNERIMLMVDKFNNLGLSIDKKEFLEFIKEAIPTRLHIGLYLKQKGYVRSLPEAFRKYLSPGKPAYVARFRYSIQEAIALIKEAEGLAFIAHPYQLREQSWIEQFATFGADGLEVRYPRLTEEKIAFYERMADQLKLLKSGGSDAHGSYKEYTKIGTTTIAYSWVEAMKKRVGR